ncbi:MAG: hypothetical protein JXX14_12105 [Deltaproteobacteria bacterium]|nr:hypothetical protein [Deltaproteobacteria bacterium]
MAPKDATAQDFLAKIRRIPQFIKSVPHSPNDFAMLTFNFRHRKETSSPQPVQTRRAKAVSAFRQKNLDVKLDLGVLTADCDHNFYRGFSEDVEEGGIFAATYNIHPIGTDVSVSFELPGCKKVFTRGVVQYTRETSATSPAGCTSGMGISFSYLENADKAAIEEYQEAHSPIFFEV